MASIYSKRNILYISWFDWMLGKTKNRSTKLPATPANKRIVEKMAKDLQTELNKKKDEYEKNSLIKGASIKSAFDHFLLNNANKHKNTKYEYNMFFNMFTKTFDENNSCMTINKIDVEAWLITIRDDLPVAQNTKHIYYKQCKHFLNFLFEYSYIPMFMINRSVRIEQKRNEIITFNSEQIERIFANLERKTSNFRTLIWMAYYTGLRPSSLITIDAGRIDLESKTYHYWDAKRKKWVENPFREELLPILKERIAEVKDGPIIVYKDASSASHAFREYLKKLGMYVKGINTKTFRKTFISNASNSMELSAVSKLVGHENITTTDLYYNKIDLERKRTELNKLTVKKENN